MTAVFLLRHPQTTWNAAHRYQGRLNTPLSDEGRRQLEQTVDLFRGEALDATYSSPLDRAKVLATSVAIETGCPLHVDQRLTEIALGQWEGLHVSAIRAGFPILYDQWYSRPDLVRFPGGETLSSVRQRALGVLSDVFAAYPQGNVAVVTHSAVLQVLVATALSLGLRHIHRLQVSNAGITTLWGTEVPGSILTFNSLAGVADGPVAAAATVRGAHREREKATQ